eukprot:tig00000144_g9126.t1
MSIPSELVEDLAKAREMWAKSRDWPTREMEKRARKLGYLYQAHSGEGFHTINLNFVSSLLPKSKQPKPEPKPEPVDVPPVPGWVKTPTGWGDPKLFAESAAETLAWAYPPQVFTNFPPPSSSSSAPQPVAEPAPEPVDDAESEASDAESDINDFIDFDVPIQYDSESSSDSEGDNENPTRKRRIIKTKSIVKKKFMETTSFTDNSERVKNPAKEHEKDLKIGAGIARSRVTSHYTERLTQHVKTIEKRIIAKREMAELRRKLRHERLLRREMTLAKIAERKKKEAAELRARVEAQQRREAEAAAALAAQREQERQDLVQAAQALPRIPLKSAPEAPIDLVSDDDDSDFEML